MVYPIPGYVWVPLRCLVMFMLAHLVSSLECGLCIAAPLDKPTRTACGGCSLERPPGRHAGRWLLRGLRSRQRGDRCSRGDATQPRLACLAGGRACARAHGPAHRGTTTCL